MYRVSRANKSKCKICPLRGQNKVKGISNHDKPKIVIVGEAPGATEDAQGEPFVGTAGKFFMRACTIAGLKWGSLYKTNVISCRPPDNDISGMEAIEAMEACKKGFVHEIKTLAKDATVFLLAGKTAMEAFGIDGSITKNRGSVYLCKILEGTNQIVQTNRQDESTIVCIPTFHPSFIMRGQWKEEVTWVNDLEKAKNISKERYAPPKEKFNCFPTVADVEKFVKRAIKNKELIGVDIETSGLHAERSKIWVVGLARNGEEAISVPFYKSGGDKYWDDDDELFVSSLLNELLAKCPTLYQNALFDVGVLRGHGYTVGDVQDDVMLLHHCLAEDTVIDTLDFGAVPIKELEGKNNFWVVSHDGNKLVPAKVSKVWKTANKRDDMVRIVFWSKNRSRKEDMWLDCTADHAIPTQNRGWVEAGKLKPGDRLVKGQTAKHMVNKKRVHKWVYEHVHCTKLADGYGIHHKDGDHWNNNPDNLMKVTKSEHNSYHKNAPYRAIIKMCQNAKERVLKEVNPDEAYNLYFNVGLSMRETAKELGTRPDRLQSLFKVMGWKFRSRSEATKLRWEKEHNCRIISVVPLKRDCAVYDMTVPKTHTYSANGIIVSNSIHPELKHDLGYVVSVYGRTPYWKDIVLRGEEAIRNVDDTTLREYNLRDAVVLHQVLPYMMEHIDKVGTYHVYKDVSMKLIDPILTMQANGIKVDKGRLAKFKKDLEKRSEELLNDIYNIEGIGETINFDSGEDLRYLFYGIKPPKYKRAVNELKEYDKPGSRKKKNSKKFRNLQAIKEAIEQTTPFYRTKSTPRKSDAGNLAVDADARLNIRIAANNRIRAINGLAKPEKKNDELAEITRLTTFLDLYNEYQKVTKLLTTYANYQTDDDGRVHGHYMIHRANTGRLASNNPNLQNVHSEAKKVFVPDDGWTFVELDYSNLELRILAIESDDDILKRTFKEGKDVHSENCKRMFGIDEKDPLWDAARRACKTYIFGRNYGGGLRGIFERVVKAVPELGLTYDRFTAIDRTYRRTHPKYAKWVEGITQRVTATRKLESGVGRVRFFLGTPDEIIREGLNFPVQSLAGDIMNRSLILIHEYLQSREYARLVGTVHDSALLEVRDNKLNEVIPAVIKLMEKPFLIRGEECSFPVDVKTGKDWANLKEGVNK